MSRCRSCGARIRWATTKNKKIIPIDAEPNTEGNVELIGNFAKVHKGPPGMFDNWTAWMPHHATCPNWGKGG